MKTFSIEPLQLLKRNSRKDVHNVINEITAMTEKFAEKSALIK